MIPLKVLHLDHTAEAGGAELALVRLLGKAQDWEPKVLLPKQPHATGLGVFTAVAPHVSVQMSGPEQAPGISSSKSPAAMLRFASQVLGQAWAIRRSQAFREADVVHANTSRTSLYGAIACLGSKTKLVLHLRDHISRQSLGALGFLAYRWVALRRADALIGNSKATLQTALRFVDADRVKTSVIASPIGNEFFEDVHSEVPRASDRGIKIGMVARLDPWKGQSLLIEAFHHAFPQGKEQLYFAGGTLFGHEDYLSVLKQQVVELGLHGRVHFLGHVDEVSNTINALDVCVQASLRPEPLGQNVLQYLAAGKAVVAANEGGPLEWINNGVNGLLFQARDAQSLATALRRLTDEKGLLEAVRSAARTTDGLITDEEVASQHFELFQRASGRAERCLRGANK